jgi:putative MATE family efflux protein
MSNTNIDYGNEPIGKLFSKLLIPTVAGMLFSVLLIITDGIFVGHGIGSDALAAVNIVAPIWTFGTGIALMFGMGGSIISSISLSQGKIDKARYYMSAALIVSTVFLILCSILILAFPRTSLTLLGCSESLMPQARLYMYGFVPFAASNAFLVSSSFFVRLDGAPKFAMTCSIIAAIINCILDYLFIFPFQFGVMGAGIATSIGSLIGAIMTCIYLLKCKHQLHFCSISFQKSGFKLTQAVKRICTLGFPSFLGELALSFMMLVGNIVFINYLGEDGVAAFSMACYFFPILFMIDSAIAQSAQPIISFNYGINNYKRIFSATRIAIASAVACSIVLFVVTYFYSYNIASLFVDASTPAHAIASAGFPIYALCFVPCAINIVAVMYFQSIERSRIALVITIMRGFLFLGLAYWFLPRIYGSEGIWLAVPAGETITCLIVIVIALCSPSTQRGK